MLQYTPDINGDTKALGIVGEAIKHTWSPRIHNASANFLGINCIYMPFDLVNMFFTFWASAAMRSPDKINMKKSILEKMFGWMLPSGTGSLALSNLNFGGMGLNMMKIMMKQKGISSLEELIEAAAELDVNINICDMSMDIIGFKKEEFRKYPNLKFWVQKFLCTFTRSLNIVTS